MALVKYNNNSISAVTATAIPSGSLILIKTLTASSSATLSFVHGTDGVVLDSTYPIYRFEFINIHPSVSGKAFVFNVSIDSGSNYNIAKTSSFFRAYHGEGGAGGVLGYESGSDLAQGTGNQRLTEELIGNGNDECAAGTMNFFNPSSTTFVKHFIATMSAYHEADYQVESFIAGYANTTSAVNAIRFQMSSGNIDSGKIKLYGIKDS